MIIKTADKNTRMKVKRMMVSDRRISAKQF